MIRCPSCGNENKEGEAFCAFCAAILQGPPQNSDTLPPPRAPAENPKAELENNIPPPPPPEEEREPSKEKASQALDPLDQFLVAESEKKNGPSEFKVEELGSFAKNFDNLEDQLEDAHRAAVLKQKMATLHGSEEAAAGGDKFNQLDAILDQELEKAKQAANAESTKSQRTGKEEKSKVDPQGMSEEQKLAKLDRYKKFLEDPNTESGSSIRRAWTIS